MNFSHNACFLFAVVVAISSVSLVAAENETVQKTVVWKAGQDGYHTYRIPSLMVAADGNLLAFAEGRRAGRSDTGAIDLVMKRSTDGGSTWGDQMVVWKDEGNTCGNPCPVLDETTGRIHLLLTKNLGSDHESAIKKKTSKSTRTVWVCHSDDHGKSWSQPTEITSSVKDPDWGWYATGPGVGIQIQHGTHQGRLVIPCDHSYTKDGVIGAGKGSHIVYSDDHGNTWQLGGLIRPEMNECQVVEIDDSGTLLIDMRSYRGKGCRAQATSTDGGQTWSTLVDAQQRVAPVCQASILRASWPETDKAGVLVFSSPRNPKSRLNLTLLASFDQGTTWDWQYVLHEKASAYSCLTVRPNGDVACLAEIGEKSPYETIALFTLKQPAPKN